MRTTARKWAARGAVASGTVVTALLLTGATSPAVAAPAEATPAAAGFVAAPDRDGRERPDRDEIRDRLDGPDGQEWRRCLSRHGVTWDKDGPGARDHGPRGDRERGPGHQERPRHPECGPPPFKR